MRIISGHARGKRLFAPKKNSLEIRPTSDRAREALFSILSDRCNNAKVLDLYAGTGGLGLEAFSRGASLVIFIDHHQNALNIIKSNILHCLHGYRGNGEMKVIQHDLSRSLPVPTLSALAPDGFDLIFADPPYDSALSLSALEQVGDSGLIKQDGTLIIEERSSFELPLRHSMLHQMKRKIYGEVGFSFYEWRELNI